MAKLANGYEISQKENMGLDAFRNFTAMWFFFTQQYPSSPELLCRFAKGFNVTLALDVQLTGVDPNELEDSDFPILSELTFLVLFVAVLLQSATISQTLAADGLMNLFHLVPLMYMTDLNQMPSSSFEFLVYQVKTH